MKHMCDIQKRSHLDLQGVVKCFFLVMFTYNNKEGNYIYMYWQINLQCNDNYLRFLAQNKMLLSSSMQEKSFRSLSTPSLDNRYSLFTWV